MTVVHEQHWESVAIIALGVNFSVHKCFYMSFIWSARGKPQSSNTGRILHHFLVRLEVGLSLDVLLCLQAMVVFFFQMKTSVIPRKKFRTKGNKSSSAAAVKLLVLDLNCSTARMKWHLIWCWHTQPWFCIQVAVYKNAHLCSSTAYI